MKEKTILVFFLMYLVYVVSSQNKHDLKGVRLSVTYIEYVQKVNKQDVTWTKMFWGEKWAGFM